MKKGFAFNDELLDDELEEINDDELDEQSLYSDRDYSCLDESDFYPPSDNRVWRSNVEDIEGGDNFADYCRYIFKTLEEEEYYDN